MSDPKIKQQKTQHQIKTRQPQKKTDSGIFANLRNLPHPVEEILGLSSSSPPEEKVETFPSQKMESETFIDNSLTTNSYPIANGNPLAISNPVLNNNQALDEPSIVSLVNSNLVANSNPLAISNPVLDETQNETRNLHTSTATKIIDDLASNLLAISNPVVNSNPLANNNPLALQPGSKLQPGSNLLPTSKKQSGNNTKILIKHLENGTASSGYIPVPNTIFDTLLPQLKPAELAIWLRLYRLSFGFNKNTCKVGLSALARRTNTSIDTARRTIRELQNKGLIRALQTDNTGTDMGGTEYEIHTIIGALFNNNHIQPSSNLQPPSNIQLGSNLQPDSNLPSITDDDHDDLNITDHHQSEHEKAVMTIYQKITNNNWTKADSKSHEKVKSVPVEKIEIAIRLAKERANSRPNSFAYFVKEILTVANPPQQSRSQHKKALEKVIDRVRTSRVGGGSYNISDLAYDVKEICVREGVLFDHDIFNEVIDKNKL